jgi:hypothetical protein
VIEMNENKHERTNSVKHNTFTKEFKEMRKEERELYLFLCGGFSAK